MQLPGDLLLPEHQGLAAQGDAQQVPQGLRARVHIGLEPARLAAAGAVLHLGRQEAGRPTRITAGGHPFVAVAGLQGQEPVHPIGTADAAGGTQLPVEAAQLLAVEH